MPSQTVRLPLKVELPATVRVPPDSSLVDPETAPAVVSDTTELLASASEKTVIGVAIAMTPSVALAINSTPDEADRVIAPASFPMTKKSSEPSIWAPIVRVLPEPTKMSSPIAAEADTLIPTDAVRDPEMYMVSVAADPSATTSAPFSSKRIRRFPPATKSIESEPAGPN